MSMYSSVSVIWVLVAAALVFFMQAGFAMVETGFTRAKNAGNIIMKNLMDFAIGTPIYWLFGFGLMFAGSSALVGGIDLFSMGDYASVLPEGIPKYVFLFSKPFFVPQQQRLYLVPWQRERNLFHTVFTVQSLVQLFTLYLVIGFGVGVGCHN